MAALSDQAKRDLTVALVGYASWAAVAWKLLRADRAAGMGTDALLAVCASLLCLWPVLLGIGPTATYKRWREWLVPAHLAVQHWVGLRFSTAHNVQQLLVPPVWARGTLPIFLAAFSQPWLYLAFGAYLHRTRLRTFLWTQPLLLVPMMLRGRAHCASQLAATPEAAAHLRSIAAALQRTTAWLPVGPLHGGGGGAAAADGVGDACLAVHMWLVLLLAYCLPAIMIHRWEAQEREAAQRPDGVPASSGAASPRQGRAAAAAARGSCSPPRRGRAAAAAGSSDAQQRDLLLQRQQTLLDTGAELLLAGYAAWLAVQLLLPLAA